MEEGEEEQDFSRSLCSSDLLGEDALEDLCHKVFITAENGWLAALNYLLRDCTHEYRDAALRFRSEADGETVTPLVAAAKAGHLAIVNALVKDFCVDLERPGTVAMDDRLIADATALWCAAAWGHFDIVKLLVDAGADVDHACASKSTPLRAACYIGRIDIVHYLVSNGADVNAVNDCGNSCLMLAAYRDHVEVVRYLVEHGANVDHTHDCGTALHLAAEAGHGSVVTYLISCNACTSKNKHGMTPIMAAAANAKVDVVEYLAATQPCGPPDRVEAYELLAAAFANDSEHTNLSMSYYYMCAAMLERDRCALAKAPTETLEDYDFQRECCSLAELEAIKADEGRLCLEALLMQERILGIDHSAVPAHLEYRAALLTEAGMYHGGLRLSLRAAQMKLKNDFFINEELWRVTRSFALMLEAGIPIACTLLKRAMELVCLDIGAARAERDDDHAEKAVQSDMYSMLYMVAFASKSRLSKVETYDLRCVIYRFCKMGIRLPTGCSLLHMAVSHRTYVDAVMADAISFPNSDVASWLLACGHSADCRDNLGNTPLHIIVQYINPINDFTTLHDIIMLVAKYGSHLDCTNVHGKTALQCCATGVAEVILRLQIQPRLKCLAARAVKRNFGRRYEGVLPKDLLDFVSLH